MDGVGEQNRWRPLVLVALAGLLVAGACSSPSGSGRSTGGDGASGSGRWATERDDVIELVDVTAPGASGRFRMGVTMGAEGVMILETSLVGEYDGSGASEVVLDLGPLVEVADPSLAEQFPEGAGDALVVRTVGTDVYVHTGAVDREWVLSPIEDHDLIAEIGLPSPDELVSVVESAGVDIATADGGTIDGVAAHRYSGWIDGSSLGLLSPGAQQRGLDELAAAYPVDLFDRIVRFDLWVGDDGLPRRLVVEYDHDSMLEIAERIDGPQGRVDLPLMRFEVEWYDLGAPIHIDAPPRDQISVVAPGP